MRLIVILVAAGVMPAALRAQDRWERQVEARVGRAIDAVTTSPRAAVVGRTGSLNIDEAATLRASLIQGTSYAIVAVCDDDCSRLQLTLLTRNGSEIAKERNSESLPMLHFTPSTTQVYGVRVVMEGCRLNPCRYAVAIVPLGKSRS